MRLDDELDPQAAQGVGEHLQDILGRDALSYDDFVAAANGDHDARLKLAQSQAEMAFPGTVERSWRGAKDLTGIRKIMRAAEAAGDPLDLRQAAREFRFMEKQGQATKAAERTRELAKRKMRGDDNPWNLWKEPKSFADEQYPVVNRVKVTFPDGDQSIDWIKGLNRGHAESRAKDNWDAWFQNPIGTKQGVPSPREPNIHADPFADYPAPGIPQAATKIETLGSFKYNPDAVHPESMDDLIRQMAYEEDLKKRQGLFDMIADPSTKALRDKLNSSPYK